MGIYSRQFNKVLSDAVLKYLLAGRLPNIDQITRTISTILGSEGRTTYQYIPQPSRSVFQNLVYNKSLKRIKFDIDLLHEEILYLIDKAADRVSYSDLYHKVNSYELSKLQAELESLLFVTQNADFYFLGAFDTFSDTSKTDSDSSTQDIVDLREQCIALPFGGKGTQKIYAFHLYRYESWPVTIESEAVLSNSIVAGTSFGNMFSDTTSAWAYEVRTSTQDPVSIRFVFPLAGAANEEAEVFINRMEVIPHSPKPQKCIVRVSNDNVNYIAPLGYEEGIDLIDQKTVYAMDFETNLVQFVEITLTKNTPDAEILNGSTKEYQFLFGLKNFSAYSTGRIKQATYQSIPYDFSGNEEQISKVSIEADQITPPGCEINYSVALADDAGIVSSFVPITPIQSSSSQLGVDQVVIFNSASSYSNRVVVAAGEATSYGTAFQGKKFYRIGPPVDPDPIFGTCRLYRGFNSWYRDASQSFELVNISDTYISFEETDIESLYTFTSEVAQARNVATVETIRRVQLTLSKPVYYNSARGHLLKPPPDVGLPANDVKPNYAIAKVILNTASTRQTLSFSLGTELTQYLPSTSFIIQSVNETELPVLRLSSGQVLRRNIDYQILTEDVGGRQKPTGYFSIPTGSALLNASGAVNTPGQVLEFSFTNDPDITHKVEFIQDNFVTLVNATLSASDSITIEYRYVPSAPNEIVKASIRVSDLPSTSNNRTFYVEGRDYVVDPSTGGIQRIPTGSISNRGSVYVSFSFRNAELGIQTFVTWCNIPDQNGVQIRFDVDSSTRKNKLTANSQVGEAFYVNTTNGLIDLTKAINTPVLGPGWVQFVVRSKNPDANLVYGTNLVNQVLQLRDISGRKVFKANNQYFREITAFREPMRQVTLNHLKVNTLLSDHSVFSIDDTTDPLHNYIVLNFSPGSTNELYLYGPTVDSEELTNPQVIPEEFLFQWQSKNETEVVGNKLIVRIELSRKEGIDGGLSPKVFEYKLRAST